MKDAPHVERTPPRLRANRPIAPRRQSWRDDHRRAASDHGGEADHQADDPSGDVLAHEHRAEEHGDSDDPAGGHETHETALDLGAAPLAARDHALRALVGFGLRICDRGASSRGSEEVMALAYPHSTLHGARLTGMLTG